MKIYISGGCKNGKSTYAEKIAAYLSSNNAYYIATMIPVDDEDKLRIYNHKQSRKHLGFKTLECGRNITNITDICDKNSTFLIDSATALLANEMFLPNGEIDLNAYKKVTNELLEVINYAKNVIIVSDYIYSDAQFYDEYTESYRKSLAYIDCSCAKVCDVVIEVCLTSIIFHKGEELMGGICEKLN